MKRSCSSALCLTCFVIISALFACKKEEPNLFDSWVSFKYDGKHYYLPYGSGAEFSIIRGVLVINRPDLFGGQVFYRSTGCAYLQPPGRSFDIPDAGGNCTLTENRSPLRDSVGLFLYLSGSLHMVSLGCRNSNLMSGQFAQTAQCEMEGTFDLVLKDRDNKTITITEGKFHHY